jgi:Na+-transporting NADH:ubiquinone oxidoreductase subunit NqrF
MNVQVLPKLLSDAYTMFDSLNLSVTALVVIGLLLAVVFIFAAREAASWFFKIDDLKKDVKKVSQLVVDMEAEIRLLQGLLSQNVKLATPPEPQPAAPPVAAEKTRFSLNN